MAQQKNYELFQFASLCDKPQPELALDSLVVHVPQIAVATRFQMVARLLLGWQLSVECSSSLPRSSMHAVDAEKVPSPAPPEAPLQ